MKTFVKFLIISIALIVMNCAHDGTLPVQGNVQIAVAVSTKTSDGGRVASVDLPDSAYVSLSIETTSGVSVYSLKRIELIKLGDGFITAPVVLTEGNYRLTDFMILSKHNEVLYATPKEGSSLASLVDDPLPVNFSITKDGILNLNVEVVSTTQQTPQDFGYVSFAVEVVKPDYAISLFIAEGNELRLASGKLELYQGNDLIYKQNLDSKVNAVNFKGDPNATYTLFVIKEGYTLKTRTYVLHELLDELGGKPLTFILEPAFTIRVTHHDIFDANREMTFNLSLNGVAGAAFRIKVDWGDGTVETIQDHYPMDGSGPTQLSLHHFYSPNQVGTLGVINVTGDIANAVWFILYNPLPLSITDVDLASLTNMDFIYWDCSKVATTDTPQNIDVSKNLKLTALSIAAANIRSLDISNNHLIRALDISSTPLSAAQVSKVIGDLYTNVTTYNINLGYFGFLYNRFGGPPEPLVPLSDESKLKLIHLRDNYNWRLEPSTF